MVAILVVGCQPTSPLFLELRSGLAICTKNTIHSVDIKSILVEKIARDMAERKLKEVEHMFNYDSRLFTLGYWRRRDVDPTRCSGCKPFKCANARRCEMIGRHEADRSLWLHRRFLRVIIVLRYVLHTIYRWATRRESHTRTFILQEVDDVE